MVDSVSGSAISGAVEGKTPWQLGKPGEPRFLQTDIVIVIDDIDADDLFASAQKRRSHMEADEAGSAGYHHRHDKRTPTRPGHTSRAGLLGAEISRDKAALFTAVDVRTLTLEFIVEARPTICRPRRSRHCALMSAVVRMAGTVVKNCL